MQKHYDSNNISFFETGALSKCLQICFASFTISGASNSGKILTIWGKATV